ncbi:MAG: zinc metallopeptidase [Planctomycetaceae bacterium]|nr:zinc metallopeptidase [Planctomycetaceae bacterium]
MIGYMIFLAPAMLLMMWAQHRVKASYADGMRVPAPLSGAAAARHILDTHGMQDVPVEQTPGRLSDHYDPGHRVLRLSPEVYQSRTASAVGIAAHEAGHALQHATHYAPLIVRNAAVPAAQIGPGIFMISLFIGSFLIQAGSQFGYTIIWFGIAAYAGVFVFQLINLPVEFDASNRAKRLLNELGIVDETGAQAVRRVLNSAAWTYVAATLQSLLTVLFYVFQILGRSNRR